MKKLNAQYKERLLMKALTKPKEELIIEPAGKLGFSGPFSWADLTELAYFLGLTDDEIITEIIDMKYDIRGVT